MSTNFTTRATGVLVRIQAGIDKIFGGGTRSRTEIHGFAIRCIANLPFRHSAKYFIILLNFYLKVVWSGKQDLHPVGAPVATTWVRNLTNRKDSAFTSKFKTWSGKRDSNSRPQPWQGCALPLSYSRIMICNRFKMLLPKTEAHSTKIRFLCKL